MPQTYPLLLDVTDRLVVIVGGGAVAARKARGLLDAGAARVRVVAPSFHEQMPGGVERIIASFEPMHLDGAALAFAATDAPHVNEAVVRECRRRGILVNRADADELDPGDFATPALIRAGAITITVSAGGSPALAASIRDAIQRNLDPRWAPMAQAMQALRPWVRATDLPIARRREIFRDLATEEAMTVLAQTDIEGLRRWLIGRYPELR